jgi:hypothetical protein
VKTTKLTRHGSMDQHLSWVMEFVEFHTQLCGDLFWFHVAFLIEFSKF